MITPKFHSDILNKDFSTEKEAVQAEKEYEEVLKRKKLAEEERLQKIEALKAERTARAKEVDAAIKAAAKARNKANDLINAFIRDYGSYHSTITEGNKVNGTNSSLTDLFNSFFTLF